MYVCDRDEVCMAWLAFENIIIIIINLSVLSSKLAPPARFFRSLLAAERDRSVDQSRERYPCSSSSASGVQLINLRLVVFHPQQGGSLRFPAFPAGQSAPGQMP